MLYGSATMQLAHATWSQNQAWAGVYYIDDATLPALPYAAQCINPRAISRAKMKSRLATPPLSTRKGIFLMAR